MSASRTRTAEPDLAARLDRAVARYWDARAPAIGGRRPRLALFGPAPAVSLRRALSAVAALDVFTGPLQAALPERASGYDHVLALVASTPAHGGTMALASRLGSAMLLRDGYLVAAYDQRPDSGRRLAEQELGRPVDAVEWAHWRAGTLRPASRLLGEIAGPVLVHGDRLKAAIASTIVPMPLEPCASAAPAAGEPVVVVRAGPQAVASCVWALEQWRAWGVAARLMVVGGAPVQALAASLGVSAWVEWSAGPIAGDVAAFVAMPGENSLVAPLVRALGAGMRCVASRWLVESVAAPGWVWSIADEPSPILLAEAVVTALATPPPGRAEIEAFREAHSPAAFGRAVCAALGWGA